MGGTAAEPAIRGPAAAEPLDQRAAFLVRAGTRVPTTHNSFLLRFARPAPANSPLAGVRALQRPLPLGSTNRVPDGCWAAADAAGRLPDGATANKVGGGRVATRPRMASGGRLLATLAT